MITKKRVLFFVPKFPVLSETFIEREIIEISNRGIYDVVVFCLEKEPQKNVDSSLEKKVIFRKLSVLDFVVNLPFILFNTPNFFGLLKFLNKSEANFFYKIWIIIKALGYSALFKKLKPDFIIAHFMSHPSTLCMLVSKILNIPYGISAHARDITVNPEFPKIKCATSKFILICNKNAFKHYINLCEEINHDHVFLQYHGLNFDDLEKEYSLAKISVKNPDVPVLLNIGRFTEKKGQRYLIEASKILKDKHIAHMLYLMGGGKLYDRLLNQIKENDLGDCVKIVGQGSGIPFLEVLSYFKISDLFVFSSIKTDDGDEDGLANVLVEASALRVPIIATNAGSTEDLIENNNTGIVVNQKDSQALADAIIFALNNKEQMKKIAENAYNKAKQMLDVRENVKKIEKLIEENI